MADEPRHTIAMAEPMPCPARYEVAIWHAMAGPIWPAPDARRRAVAWLSPAETARHARYRRDADRDMFLLGRVMARRLVGGALGVAPTAWTWDEGPRGRPAVGAPRRGLSFNLAHSGGVVVCALAWHADVGVDVEDRHRPAIDASLVARCCAPAEVADIEAHGPDGWRDHFLKYWTLKEAYLKARGLGIAVHLPDLAFRLSDVPGAIAARCEGALAGDPCAWAFDLRPITPHHWLAAAMPVADARPTFVVRPFPAGWLP